jgi:hypothetical protein
VIPTWLLVIALLTSGSEHVAEREDMVKEMTTEIELTLTNELPFEREAEPITCGVPLARGFVSRADELTLFGPDGRPVPVQIQITSTYKDNTPRWVLLDFQADVPAGGKAIYRLAKGQRTPVNKKLTFRLEYGRAEIDTGVAQFRIDTSRFRLFDSVTVGGNELLAGDSDSGAILEEEDGSRYSGDLKTTKAEFEDAGPMSVVLAVCGQIRPGEDLPLADYVCRMHFYAGKSEVRVFYTLHNPAAHRHPGFLHFPTSDSWLLDFAYRD